MMLPEGWEKLALGRKIKVQGGFAFKSEEFGQVGLPIVRISNIQGGKIQLEKAPRYHEEKGLRRFYLNDGDILIAMSGATTGKIGTFESSENFPTAYLNQRVGRFVPVEKRSVDISFFHQIFRTARFQHLILIDALGGAQPNVSGKEIESLVFSIPPLPEQRRIAEILSTWDRAIETVEALIANARAQKKALMQSLLTGKHRLPGFSGEWETVALKSMGKISSGGTPDSDNDIYWNGDILWTTPTDITALNRKYITDTKRKISATGLANCSAKLLPAGTLLICTRATIGDMAIATSPISTNQGFKNLTPNASFVSEFLFHLFGFHKHIFIRYACGSTFLELSKFDFEKREFLVPERAEQQAIANVLDDADLEIESFEAKAQTLRQEKSALMQQLLTGKRRVRVDEREDA